jgi:hypothetical protein
MSTQMNQPEKLENIKFNYAQHRFGVMAVAVLRMTVLW